MKNLSVNVRAIILIFFAFASYNAADAFLKKAQDYYSFAEAAFYPIVCYFIFTVLLSKQFGSLTTITKTKKLKLHVIRSFCGTSCFVSMVLAFKYITLAEAYTLILTAPFWVAIFSLFFFKEKIGPYRWISIFLGFIGVLIVLRPGIAIITPASILPLFAAIGFSLFVIYSKKIGEEEPMINMVIYPIISDLIVLVPIILYMGGFTPPQIEHFHLFLLSGGLYLAGTTLASLGYASGESSALGIIQYSQILWGILIGYFFFAEKPEIWTLLGAVIIVLSGIYLIYREHKVQT